MQKFKSILFLITTIFLITSCGESNSDKKVVIEKSQVEKSNHNITVDPVTENRYGYLKEIVESNPNHDLFIKVDYVDYLTGKEAMEAEWRDKAYFVDGTDTITNITDGYYISNVNPKIRIFKIAKDASIENVISDDGPHKMKEIKHPNAEQLKKYIDMNNLLFFHIENGVVKSIDERFMP